MAQGYSGNHQEIIKKEWFLEDGTTTIYVAGMEITRVDDTETERTIYYGAGGAFRVIEAGDTAYTQADSTTASSNTWSPPLSSPMRTV